jgi:chorismate dehydratase
LFDEKIEFNFSRLTFAAKIKLNELDRKIRVGAVSYLNTKPLLYGIEHSPVINKIELKIDYPSRIAAMLLDDEIDMGLVPIAILPQLKEYYINTDCCIGSDGAVASVCIFSEVPIENVENVLLDYQSRTSVQLAKILLKEYWKTHPVLTDAKEDFRDHIKGTTAGLIIGDRALDQRKISPFNYDLGEAWKNLTGLPFVFAAWVSNKKLDDDFIKEFGEANKSGIENMNALLKELRSEIFDLKKYYTEYISFNLDEKKIKGLDLFLKKLY